MKTVNLIFRPQQRSAMSISESVDGEILMEALMDNDVTTLLIDWMDVGHIALAVEDDAIFLFEAFQGLDGLMDEGTHYAFLGDGELEVIAKLRGEMVDVEYRYSPQLDSRRTVNKSVSMRYEEYVGAWAAVLDAMMRTAGLQQQCDPCGGGLLEVPH